MLCFHQGNGQILSDDFENSTFSSPLIWMGDTLKFKIDSQLVSNSQIVNDQFYISCPVSYDSLAFLSLDILLDFNTSSANYVDVVFLSDSSDFNLATNKYFVRLGGSKDEIALFGELSSDLEMLLDGPDKVTENATIKLRLYKSETTFLLYVDLNSGSEFIGQFTDTLFPQNGYFGLLIKQSTTSFHGKHFFDNLYLGPPIRDTVPPQIENIAFVDNHTLQIDFSEAVIVADLNTSLNIEPKLLPDSVVINQKSWLFFFDTVPNNVYLFKCTNIKDTSGNEMKDTQMVLEYFIPDRVRAGDIVINEILFNPLPNSIDFIELINRSKRVLALKDLIICRYQHSERTDLERIESDRLLYPGDIIVLCEDDSTLMMYHWNIDAKNLIVQDIPPMNNGEGIVLLLDSNYQIVDSISYNEAMHFELLNSNDGVSLERISIHGSSTSASNWTSASEVSGFSTPGLPNSQQFNPVKSQQFTLAYRLISPNNDGFQDFLALSYNLNETNVLCNLYVYDKHGHYVDHIVNNTTLSAQGELFWDCVLDDKSKLAIGDYVLVLEGLGLSGQVYKEKLAFSIWK